ncbi:MAG: hypothetical protein N0A16_10265 [Blastocatellia bacterium]|nr:hypothetical protein [Blastocatellia bacterium]MCS7158099.1 hypothetical protein [Blastocatellia bacterium]MCX7753038.1 hypothetical protein [Blastocatellia bacterium]MDW8168561.1 hypothetical protein [Acidobacteriota bacterium]MDW8257276.1 hypothetical protein [Acidobacteriota bacterium]
MSPRLIAWLERLARRLGIDPHQYWHLLHVSLILDFRRQSALSAGQDMRSPLLMTCLIYGIFSLIFALFTFRTLELFHYSLIFLAYSMLMVAFIVLSEFGATIVSPDDYEILGHRPISSRTYFAAKLSNLLFYVLLIGSALNVFPALLGAFSDAEKRSFPFAYFPVALLASLFSAMLIVLLYGALLRVINYERFKDVLVYVQIVFSFVVIFGYQVILRAMPYWEQEGLAESRRAILLTPPGWFASLVQIGLGQWERDYMLWAGWGMLMTGVLVGAGLRSFSLEYSFHLARLRAATAERWRARSPIRRRIARALERLVARSPEERAAFYLIRRMLRRDRALKLRLYPALGFPIAFIALGIAEKSLTDPFLPSKRFPSTAFFTLLVGPLLIMNFQALLPYSQEHAAAWLFRVTPVRDLVRFFAGVRKAFLIFLLLPLFLLIGASFAWFWKPWHAFLYAVLGFALSYIFLGIAFLFYRGGFPFSQEPAKMTQTRQVTLAFLSMPIFGVFLTILYVLSKHPKWLIVALGLILLLGWILNRAADRRAAHATWMQQELEGGLFQRLEEPS